MGIFILRSFSSYEPLVGAQMHKILIEKCKSVTKGLDVGLVSLGGQLLL